MATTAADRVFVDTNVLVQSIVPAAPLYGPALIRLHQLRQDGVELWTSRQVLREFVVALTQPTGFATPLPANQAVADVAFLQSTLSIAEENAEVTAHLLALVGRFSLKGKQIHDANIVATMQVHRIRKLLTAQPTDYAVFGGLIIPMPVSQ